jgi:hypothetical protein
LSAEIAKYDDTNELKEEQRNDLYLVVQRWKWACEWDPLVEIG